MLNGLDLFSGIGGITLALQEWVTPIAYCEIEPYCQSLLLQRMQEKSLPTAPVWDDIRTLSIKELPEIDIIYGGFPCQDISVARHGNGVEGKRSSLVFEVFSILDKTKSPFLFLENVPNIRTRGAERICKDLAKRGYDCRWCCVSAGDVGALHKRERWFLLAYSQSKRCKTGRFSGRKKKKFSRFRNNDKHKNGNEGWETEPCVARMAHGISNRVDRIKALGNAVVPLQVKKAFEILKGDGFDERF